MLLGKLGKTIGTRLSPTKNARRVAFNDLKSLRGMRGNAAARKGPAGRENYAAQHSRARIHNRAGQVYERAHKRTIKRNVGLGIGAYGLSMQASNGRGQTSANQNTFTRNALLGRNTVGISSGALQGFDQTRRSLGGL
jgi:hypothetical protein